MSRRPPRSTRTDTLFPYTTRFRSERVPVARDAKPASLRERMAPLRNLQVWRFSLYYFLVFGGFIALASWLPRYHMGVYGVDLRSEEHTSELPSLMRISYAVFCLKKKKKYRTRHQILTHTSKT